MKLQDIEPFLKQCSGVKPEHWVSVFEGISAEDVKNIIFSQSGVITPLAVHSLENLISELIKPGRVFPTTTRFKLATPLQQQILLEWVWKNNVLKENADRFPHLLKHSKRRGWLNFLHKTLQEGRLQFSRLEEAFVLDEALESSGIIKNREYHRELLYLSVYYETALMEHNLLDIPLAIEKIQNELGEWRGIYLPKKWMILNVYALPPRIKNFFQFISSHFAIEFLYLNFSEASLDLLPQRDCSLTEAWNVWHSLDDLTFGVSQKIQHYFEEYGKLDQLLVVIPDDSHFRLSFYLRLRQFGIEQEDSRNPLFDKLLEDNKKLKLLINSLLERLDRRKNIESFWNFKIDSNEIQLKQLTISGFKSTTRQKRLELFHDFPKGKYSWIDFQELFLKWIEKYFDATYIETCKNFFEKITQETSSFKTWSEKKNSVRWVKELSQWIDFLSTPIEKEIFVNGLKVYRYGQIPLGLKFNKILLVSPPRNWLEDDEKSDFWYTKEERSILSEFELTQKTTIAQGRKNTLSFLKYFLSEEGHFSIFDYLFELSGKERPPMNDFLKSIDLNFEFTPTYFGALYSYHLERLDKLPKVQLNITDKKLFKRPLEMSVTDIDTYTRCPFIALITKRWRFEDLRWSGYELLPEDHGQLIHAALKNVMEFIMHSKTGDDWDINLIESWVNQSIHRAWSDFKLKRVFSSEVNIDRLILKAKKILFLFIENEKDFLKFSKLKPTYLEGPSIEYNFEGWKIRGIPDRVDETSKVEGFFIWDYKTSSSLPKGREMIDLGYRLQMPVYALALSEKLNKKFLGAGYIEVKSEVKRSAGVYLKKYNGKGKLANLATALTQFNSSNHSLVALEETELLDIFKARLLDVLDKLESGNFSPEPIKKSECDSCRLRDQCGVNRCLSY